ncbi:hypothetical protein G0Q62_000751 [Listeria monocytogenes]|nr:hypothetical protein [Listeria monocytogenes]
MTKTHELKIAEKDKVFQIATKSGWIEQTGMQVTIDGIDFAIYPQGTLLQVFLHVNEMSSGASLFSIPIDLIDYLDLDLDTRDKAIAYYTDNVITKIQEKIEVNGLDKFRKEVEKAKKYMVGKYGERPEIRSFEGDAE